MGENNIKGPEVKRRERSSAYPNVNIARCIEFAEKIFNKGGRHILQDVAAKEMNYSKKDVGPFLALRAATKYFGLVEYEGDYISVSENYINVLLEKSDVRKKEFIRQAVLRPALYAKLFDTYGGKQLPGEQDLATRLYIDKIYGITRDASIDAARVFIESVKYAGLLDENNYLLHPALEKVQEHEALKSKEEIADEKKQASSLDRYEFTLETGDKILLALPPTLSTKDKDRLKRLIDLIPDRNENPIHLRADESTD